MSSFSFFFLLGYYSRDPADFIRAVARNSGENWGFLVSGAKSLCEANGA